MISPNQKPARRRRLAATRQAWRGHRAIAQSLIQNYLSYFHSLAMRRVKSWMEAMKSQAVAEAMVCSKSLARRRFRDRGHENQQTRAAALNLVTAAIILFNCRYLDRAVSSLKISAGIGNEEALRQLSPLGWDHINLTGDYVWSDPAAFDADGFLPLKIRER